jgi:gliding motility-associated-like protein
MKKLINITLTLLLFISGSAFGQINLDQQVIGSAGGFHQVSGGNSYSYTVGETMVQTTQSTFSTTLILTQGFQQTLNADSVTYEVLNESCPGAANGSIFINNVPGCSGPYSVVISTLTADSAIVGADTLSSGTYNVMIIGSNGCSYTIQIEVGVDSNEACELKFYSGITPNGDGNNDIWAIDNIELFPENTVLIFNRWGNEVWTGEGYDNDKKVWIGLDNNGVEMADATYFYVAVVGGKTHKGFIELTR